MLQIRKDLCIGCGLCANSCPQKAISLSSGQAEINVSRCNRCHLCLELCPRKAIIEVTLVSRSDLQTAVVSLKQRTNDVIKRIERQKLKLIALH